ncbi:sigma-70 family RNA polymerase sigma factor [Nocardioides deserti]|uniref:Sigma-70 family RNA polymerase sigma factor n=2 Tax=Nocardioides deserti TaxID=1588644 RepID=A0ABR6UDA6_9ACTN|nr:sigma-70 family RNA polymerase sigma factor [Nocardioides deserti]
MAVDHVPLVAHVVRETLTRVPSHVNGDDLRSAGLAALVTAARSFDPTRGVPFGSYATSRIRGAILDELRSVDWASRSVRRRSREIEEARTRLAATMGRLPDNAAVAAALGLDVTEVKRSDDDVARASVLSLSGGPDGSDAVADMVVSKDPGPEAAVLVAERLQYLQEAIAELPDRLRAVVQGYFLDERPMAELAAELGVSESRISQIRAEALVLLRDALNAALDPERLQPHPKPNGCVARRRDAYVAAVAERHAAARAVGATLPAFDTTA